MRKRKQAKCKCGRKAHLLSRVVHAARDGPPWQYVFWIACGCGQETADCDSEEAVWAEWKRLQEGGTWQNYS